MTAPAPVSARAAQNLVPESFAQDVVSLDLRTFLARHGDLPLLLVAIPPGETDLELGLTATSEARPARPDVAKPMPFRTTTNQPGPREASRSVETRAAQRANLAQRLEKNVHVAVPLHKRQDGDTMFMDRISVGRAQNKDIVLRHASISKFHAWFEVDASQVVSVSDGRSTNRTRVNGRILEPRTSNPLEPGDVVQFGTIEAVLCSPEALWSCLNAVEDKQAAL
jgi:hypothetical protein